MISINLDLTSSFKNIKYICINMKAIRVAGVSTNRTLWHFVAGSSSKYWPNSSPEYIILPIPKAENEMMTNYVNYNY